jgi:hypothetical protein
MPRRRDSREKYPPNEIDTLLADYYGFATGQSAFSSHLLIRRFTDTNSVLCFIFRLVRRCRIEYKALQVNDAL